ncbi:MAG: SpoIIE family protein phosphatase [Deltaproteobacteria bacterium]|nr:SpoIIE family protein phosphatase [Deltaproteobacteria bacterium]
MAGPRISIAWRIIIGTLFLILVLLGGFGFLSTKRLEKVYLETGKEQKEQYIKNLRFAGKAQVFTLGKLSSKFLKSSEFNELAISVPPVGREDSKIDAISVFDERGNLIGFYDSRYPGAVVKKEDKTYLVGDRTLGKKEVNFSGFPWSEFLVKRGDALAKMKGAVKRPDQIGLPKDRDVLSSGLDGIIKNSAEDQQIMLFSTPIIEENQYIGTIAMIYNLKSLQEYEKRLIKALKKEQQDSLKKIIIFGGILLLLGAIIAVFQGLRITRPIKSLVRSFSTFAQGDLGHRVQIKTNDEIQILGEGFNFMADNLVILLQETEKKAVMAKELEVARTIQETLVPEDKVHRFPFIDLVGYFQPASETGGDWWSYYKLKNDRILVIIGDVTGHGVPAAMITAAANSAFDTILAIEEKIPDLNYVMSVLNQVIAASGKGQFFMTCFASIIDPNKSNIVFANAGHNFPYMYRPSEDKFVQMMARGSRLGEVSESGAYEIKEMELLPEDIIVWYTDGIIEDENPEGMEYGEKRFRRIIKAEYTKPLIQLRDNVVKDANDFYDGIPHQDDHTMVFGRVKSKNQPE